eukprot:gene12861-27123_t
MVPCTALYSKTAGRPVDIKLFGKLRLNRLHSGKTFDFINQSEEFMTHVTRIWVYDFVHGYGMCPFAANILKNNSMSCKVMKSVESSMSAITNDLSSKIITEAKIMKDSKDYETELLILPQLSDFESYLEMSNIIEETLEETNLDEYIQLATFHPLYQFQGTNIDDVENWSNRAPYPVIHLLRVTDVSAAIAKYPRPMDSIWQNNINTLKSLGNDGVQQIMNNIYRKAKEITDKNEL